MHNTSLVDLVGTEISSFTARGIGGNDHFVLPDSHQRVVIEHDYLGDHSLLWLVIYRDEEI